ncbi:MAG: hypothetical protein H0T76_03050 [Nannocystis sp.]|nr:hypothetical protein [Nannocystis sp.]MBA3545439.1 hypothetical protein [Nannocystis sp.]
MTAATLVACTSTSQQTAPGPVPEVAAARAPIEPTGPMPGVKTPVALRLRIKLPTAPEVVAWAPGGARLVVGDDRGALQILDARTGLPVHDLGRFPMRVTGLAVSETRVAAAGSTDLRIWSAATGALERERHDHKELMPDLRFVGEELLAVDLRNMLLRWDLRGGQAVKIEVPTLHALALAIEPNGAGLAIGGYGNVELIDVPGGARRFKLEMPNCSTAPKDLLCAVWREVEIEEFPSEDDDTRMTYKAMKPNWQVSDLAFSADGTRLALGRSDGIAVVIDVATGKPIARFDAGHGKRAVVALTADGGTLAMGDGDGYLAVWDLSSRREIRVVYEPYQIVGCLAFSADDTALAAGGPGASVTIWDLGR